MKRLFGILSASAFAPLALVAGFSEYLDISALSDIPDECKKLSGNITEIGTRSGDVWVPAEVHAQDETGNLIYDGSSTITRPASLKEYIDFGSYSDESSIDAFMNRGEFYITDKYGEKSLAYTTESISSIYMEMENSNFNTFEAICEEIEKNVEQFIESEKQSNNGFPTERSIKAAKAIKKFYNSGVKAQMKSAADIANIFARKARNASTAVQKAKATQALLAAQKTSSLKSSLASRLDSLASNFEAFCMRYMDDMNTLGAYLGSTNAMLYFSANRDITDDNVLERWFKFSPPGRLNNGLYLGLSGQGSFNTIFDSIASAYGVYAFDSDGYEEFQNHFGIPAMATDKHKGFYEQEENTIPVVTNWYANGIKAPKNWADGSTIVVDDGKFKIGTKKEPWLFNKDEGKIVNCVVQVGNSLVYYNGAHYLAKYTVEQAGMHYCHVTVPVDPSQSPTITIDTTATGTSDQFTYPVCEIIQTNGMFYATYELATMPMVIIYQ